jgi:hypothetical protein
MVQYSRSSCKPLLPRKQSRDIFSEGLTNNRVVYQSYTRYWHKQMARMLLYKRASPCVPFSWEVFLFAIGTTL